MISLLEIARSINEVDDDKIIKYKDKEGESQEMTAGAAKKQPEDHPAKVAYNKMADKGGDDSEKDAGGKLGGGDFDRDSDDKGEEPKKLSSDEIDKKVKDLGDKIRNIYHSGMSPQDSERYIDGLQKQIDDLKSQKESIKVINGKKYKAIKESKEPTKPTIHLFKETYKKIGGK